MKNRKISKSTMHLKRIARANQAEKNRMTKSEFLHFRATTRPWYYSHGLTVSGYHVCGVNRMVNPSLNQTVISGRVIVNPDDCGGAQYADWDLNGVAIGHRFGNLDRETLGHG